MDITQRYEELNKQIFFEAENKIIELLNEEKYIEVVEFIYDIENNYTKLYQSLIKSEKIELFNKYGKNYRYVILEKEVNADENVYLVLLNNNNFHIFLKNPILDLLLLENPNSISKIFKRLDIRIEVLIEILINKSSLLDFYCDSIGIYYVLRLINSIFDIDNELMSKFNLNKKELLILINKINEIIEKINKNENIKQDDINVTYIKEIIGNMFIIDRELISLVKSIKI